MEKLIPIIIPDTTISKKRVKQGQYVDYTINVVLRNQPISVRIKNENTKHFELIFNFTNEAQLAVHKYHRYDSIEANFNYYAYAIIDNEPFAIPFQLTFKSDKAIINKAIEIANKKYNLGIEKDKCKCCGKKLTAYELQFENWQYCSNCYTQSLNE